MLKKQFIAILFASVLLANLGHNIVPHHHHIDSIHTCHNCWDGDAEGYTFYTENPKHHCHAFNGIEYYPIQEKYSNNKPTKLVKEICLTVVNETVQAIPFQKQFREPGGSPLVRDRLAGSVCSLRGPPCLS